MPTGPRFRALGPICRSACGREGRSVAVLTRRRIGIAGWFAPIGRTAERGLVLPSRRPRLTRQHPDRHGLVQRVPPRLVARRAADHHEVRPAPSQRDPDQPATLAPSAPHRRSTSPPAEAARRATRHCPDPPPAHSPPAAWCPRPSPALPSLSSPVALPGGPAQAPVGAYPTHGRPAEQSARRSRSSASVGLSPWS